LSFAGIFKKLYFHITALLQRNN